MDKDRFKLKPFNIKLENWLIAKMKEVREGGGESYSKMITSALMKVHKFKKPK